MRRAGPHAKLHQGDIRTAPPFGDKPSQRKAKQAVEFLITGHALMENRSGLVVQAHLSQASGTAEREAALDTLNRHSPGSAPAVAAGRSYRPGLGACCQNSRATGAPAHARTSRRWPTPPVSRHSPCARMAGRYHRTVCSEGRASRRFFPWARPGLMIPRRMPHGVPPPQTASAHPERHLSADDRAPR